MGNCKCGNTAFAWHPVLGCVCMPCFDAWLEGEREKRNVNVFGFRHGK